jgi:hypothetical protein
MSFPPVKGEAFKKVFTLIPTNVKASPILALLDEIVQKCCFKLPLFADSASSDPLKNDNTSVYFGYSNMAVSATMYLYKNGTQIATLNNNTYGTFYAFGFYNDGIKSYTGYQINWKAVLLAHGAGAYYVKCDALLITTATITEYSFDYCLKQYSTAIADGTVRIEFWHNGIIGDWIIDTDKRSFKGLNWYNSIRLPNAMIYNSRGENEYEEIQYSNGQMQDSKMEQRALFDLIIEPLPELLHLYLRKEALMSDRIVVSDYNNRSPLKPFLERELKFRGNYEPNWQGIADRSSVLIQFEQRYNNLKKLHC